MSNTTEIKIKVFVISEESILNHIASNNDMDVLMTQALIDTISVAKMDLAIAYPKNHKLNTISEIPWEVSNNDVTKARNYLLNEMDLDLTM